MKSYHSNSNVSSRMTARLSLWGRHDEGSVILFAMLLLVVLAISATIFTSGIIFESRDINSSVNRTQAFYLAEAGIQRARYQKSAGTLTGSLATGSYAVEVNWWANDGVDNDNDGNIDEGEEADFYDITSIGTPTSGVNNSFTIEALAQRGKMPHELFYHQAIYVGNSTEEPYTLELAGLGSEADDIIGDIYANGDIDVTDDAAVMTAEPYTDTNLDGQWDTGEPYTDLNGNGFYDFGTEATGTITGVSGFTGGDEPINPPGLWDEDLEAIADVHVAQEFGNPSNVVTKSAHRPNSAHNSSVQTVHSTNPAHIFAKNVLNDLGPIDDSGPTSNENYFLADYQKHYYGRYITVRSEHNRLVYFVDGNLWLEVSGVYAYLYTQTGGTQISIVVKGNIYIADGLRYKDYAKDGIAMIAVTDGETYTDVGNGEFDEGEVYEDENDNGEWDEGEEYVDAPDWEYTPGVDYLHDYGLDGIPDTNDAGEGNGLYEGNKENSGNIMLGDSNLGPVGDVHAFLFAQNNFVDYVLNDSAGDPEDFTIYGTMAAGNHVRINRARNFSDEEGHTKMSVVFDDRLRDGSLELPYLPTGPNRIFEGTNHWSILSWRQPR